MLIIFLFSNLWKFVGLPKWLVPSHRRRLIQNRVTDLLTPPKLQALRRYSNPSTPTPEEYSYTQPLPLPPTPY
jgi:hypothetical protein